MATHSSALAWRIPGTEEPGRLQSMGVTKSQTQLRDYTCLPRSKHLLISWLHSSSAVILQPKKIKSVTVSTLSPSICHEVMEPDAILVFECSVVSQLFHSPLSPSPRGSLDPLHFLP